MAAANLRDVYLVGADLAGAGLAGADLAGAVLAGVKSGGITGFPSGVPGQFKLEMGYLVGPHVDLAEAQLSGANLREVDLAGVTLVSANLTSAVLIGASLDGATLENAQLMGADMSGASLANADLVDANLSGAIFTDVESWATASWKYAFYGTNDGPTWASGMDQAWRDSVGILAIGPTSGDFNDDGVVDAADYTMWKDNLGCDTSFLEGSGWSEANVVRKDYRIWEMNFQTSESAAEAGFIPEPTSFLLAFLALIGVPLRRLAVRCG